MKKDLYVGLIGVLVFLGVAKVFPNLFFNIGVYGLILFLGYFIFSLIKRKKGRLKLSGLIIMSVLTIGVISGCSGSSQNKNLFGANFLTQTSSNKPNEESKKETSSSEKFQKEAENEKKLEEAKKKAEEKLEAEKKAQEKAAAEKAAAEKAEAERAAAEEKAQAEKEAQEKAAAEKAEAERIAAEQAEAQRIATEQAEAERIAAEQEAKRIAEEQAQQAQAVGEIVYIAPNSGTKYHHRSNCRGLSKANSVVEMNINDAMANGYVLCGWED